MWKSSFPIQIIEMFLSVARGPDFLNSIVQDINIHLPVLKTVNYVMDRIIKKDRI